jgi:hypothetical protein
MPLRLILAILLLGHGLIHLLGVVKAFRLADLPQLTQPISPVMGLLWLVAALLFLSTAGSLYLWPRGWWALALMAVVISFVVIVPSWADAKFGAVMNGVVLIAALFGYLADGPSSLFAEYEREVAAGLARTRPQAPLTEADLAHLPMPVQRYLRGVGVLGQPRVQNVRVRMRGRSRSGPDAPWMPFTAEQYNFFDEPARLFYMDASRMGLPIQGLHRYRGASASMRIKAAALFPVVTASGPEMTQAETVTMFNDMCLFAPAALIDPAIRWEGEESGVVRAAFTNAGHTIRATLVFDDAGDLANFWSDDRPVVSAGGETRPARWSTPAGDTYRQFGAVRLGARGQARWHEPSGDYAYIEIELEDVQYNMQSRSDRSENRKPTTQNP